MKVVLDAMDAPPSLRLAARILGWPFSWLGLKGDPSMPPVLRALTALGPFYVKFGQLLSTRADVVGTELANELQVLQDSLAPCPTDIARAEIEREFGRSADEIFAEFSDPVAAASIAQVHKATLAESGHEVAVKVLRPGIERAFARDIDAFYFAARWIELLLPSSRRLKPMDVITHFDGVVRGELDLRLECAAAAEFAATTKNDEGFSVPSMNWDLSSRRVMTSEWVDGIAMNDITAIDAADHNRTELARNILQLFLSHALRDLSLIHISEPTRLLVQSRMPSSA